MNDFSDKKLDYKQYTVDSKLRYFKPHATKIEKSFAEEISFSLSQNSKFINPKFFYDSKGSLLFESICLLPEYYPTRTELGILKNLESDLLPFLDEQTKLVELGSGASVKTRVLIDIFTKLQTKTEYFPIDISEILTESSEQLLKDYGTLHITGIIDTYEGGLEFLKNYDEKKNLIIFLGSSFGNFTPNNGKEFLKNIFSTMKSGDLFLIGLDLVKDKNILQYIGATLTEDVIDIKTGEIFYEGGIELTNEIIESLITKDARYIVIPQIRLGDNNLHKL